MKIDPSLSSTDFVTVSDSPYAGTIQFSGCKFYGGIGTTRTAYNIVAQPSTVVEVDKTSFGNSFKDWMGGVSGGIIRHNNEQIVYADNLDSVSVPANSTVTLKYTAKATGSNYDHYNAAYSTTTGFFTYPTILNSVHLEAICNVTTGTPAGTIAIYKNGSIDTIGTISGKTMAVRGNFVRLAAGTTLDVRVRNTSSTAFSFSVSSRDKLAIYASN